MKHIDCQRRYSQFNDVLLVLLVITVIRICYLFNNNFDLYADEAQYFSWSKNLAFGYYSKPPMIAWLIALSTKLFGHTEGAIRIFSPILHFFISYIIYLIGTRIYGYKTAYYAAILYITLPAVTLSSSLITTDPILLFFWALSIYLFILADSSNKTIYWLMAGITTGFGILSKYNMIFFFPSAAIYLYLSNGNFSFLKNKNLYLATFFAFVIYLPNFLWNESNGFVSYLHTREISQVHKSLFHPEKLAEFLLAQIALFGPVLSYIFINSLFHFKKLIVHKSNKLTIYFFAPFLIVISLLSLVSNAYGNWAAPVYVTMTLFVCFYAINYNKEKILQTAFVVNIIIAGLFYSYPLYQNNLQHYNIPDPYQRLRGWSDLGAKVNNIAKDYPDCQVISDDRKTLAELLYYTGREIYKWNTSNIVHDHYDMTRRFNTNHNRDIIFIAKDTNISDISRYFVRSNHITNIKITINNTKSLDYKVYYLQSFKGY